MGSRWRVVFLDADTFDRGGDVSYRAFQEQWPCLFHARCNPAEVLGRISGSEVVVTNKVVLDAATLRAAKDRLRLVAVAATGTNNIDLEAAAALGIPVCNVAGYSGYAVAQHAFALILELATHAGGYARDNREGAWARSPVFTLLSYPCFELRGRVLGLVGYGDIAKNLERMATAFGMEVLVAARRSASVVPTGRVAFEEVLRRADVVSLHCPLTPETRNLIGAAELGRMKPGAFLVNTARGGVADEGAVLEALRTKRLGGAAFDVLTQEPPPPDHPMLRAASEMENLLLTPHTAWSTREARQRLLDEVCANILAFEQGGTRNRVAPRPRD